MKTIRQNIRLRFHRTRIFLFPLSLHHFFIESTIRNPALSRFQRAICLVGYLREKQLVFSKQKYHDNNKEVLCATVSPCDDFYVEILTCKIYSFLRFFIFKMNKFYWLTTWWWHYGNDIASSLILCSIWHMFMLPNRTDTVATSLTTGTEFVLQREVVNERAQVLLHSKKELKNWMHYLEHRTLRSLIISKVQIYWLTEQINGSL